MFTEVWLCWGCSRKFDSAVLGRLRKFDSAVLGCLRKFDSAVFGCSRKYVFINHSTVWIKCLQEGALNNPRSLIEWKGGGGRVKGVGRGGEEGKSWHSSTIVGPEQTAQQQATNSSGRMVPGVSAQFWEVKPGQKFLHLTFLTNICESLNIFKIKLILFAQLFQKVLADRFAWSSSFRPWCTSNKFLSPIRFFDES